MCFHGGQSTNAVFFENKRTEVNGRMNGFTAFWLCGFVALWTSRLSRCTKGRTSMKRVVRMDTGHANRCCEFASSQERNATQRDGETQSTDLYSDILTTIVLLASVTSVIP